MGRRPIKFGPETSSSTPEREWVPAHTTPRTTPLVGASADGSGKTMKPAVRFVRDADIELFRNETSESEASLPVAVGADVDPRRGCGLSSTPRRGDTSPRSRMSSGPAQLP